jgi:regulatory protein
MAQRAEPGEAGSRTVSNVIERLKELNYLDDTRFAADYTRLRKENQKLGPRRVRQDLAVKGVAKELISDAVSSIYDNVDEVALAREYIERKRIKQPEGENRQKDAARVMGRLLRAGFSAGTVYKVIREWGADTEELEPAEAESAELSRSDSLQDPDGE